MVRIAQVMDRVDQRLAVAVQRVTNALNSTGSTASNPKWTCATSNSFACSRTHSALNIAGPPLPRVRARHGRRRIRQSYYSVIGQPKWRTYTCRSV